MKIVHSNKYTFETKSNNGKLSNVSTESQTESKKWKKNIKHMNN